MSHFSCGNYCGLKAFDYARFGLYYLMKSNRRLNFCDVHLQWTDGASINLGDAYYSGSEDSMNDIQNVGRTQKDMDRYADTDRAPESLDLDNGGKAYLIRGKKDDTFDIWLFGPLRFQEASYGSLVVELKGLMPPRTMHRTDPQTGQAQVWTVFPNGRDSYHACTVWGSDYLDVYPRSSQQFLPALSEYRKHVFPARLPSVANGVVWKMEAFLGKVTLTQLYAEHG